MLNIEKPNLNIEPEPTLKDFEIIHKLRDELEEKLKRVTETIRNIDKARADANTSPETLETLDATKQKLEQAHEVLTEQLPEKTEYELFADKIRSGAELSKEDLKFREEHWVDIEKRLLKLGEPQPVVAPENFIENTRPTLERSRTDYAEAIFKNKLIVEPANQAYLESLQKKYQDNITTELEKVQPENEDGGTRIAMTKARLAFLEDERDQFNAEIFKLENEETKKRIGKALDKAFMKVGEVTGDGGEVVGRGINATTELVGKGINTTTEFVGKGINTALDYFKNKKPKKKGSGMPWWYYAVMTVGAPVLAGNWVGGKIHEKITDSVALLKEKFNKAMTPEKDTKKTDLQEKYGTKKPKEGSAPGLSEDKTKEQLEKEKKIKEVEARKKEFLEKAFDAKLEGENLKQWEKAQKASIRLFFKPTKWTVDTYKPWQKAIYDKLIEIYKKDTKTKDTVKLGDYITSLAEQDKLKDLWNQTSSSNS